MEWTHERLEGRIVVLEPLRAEHHDPLAAAAADAEVWRWMSVRGHDAKEFRAWFDSALAAADELPFATLDAGTGAPVGSTRYLSLAPEHRRLEIGHTWLARSHWRSGANAEAKLLMLEYAFERLGCRRVEFKTDALNPDSRRALEALPAQFEGIHRKHMLVRGGESRDSAWYSVLDDEWPHVRANLRRRLQR